MKPLLLLAVVLLAPARASAGAALDEAEAAAGNPASFDGAKPRSGAVSVSAGDYDYGPGDGRRRVRRHERPGYCRTCAPTPVEHGVDREPAPTKAVNFLSGSRFIAAGGGAILGLLIGSIWGLTGLGIGLAVGALLGYGLSFLKS